MDEAFGPLVSFSDVERALIDHMRIWAHTYLAARERKAGITVGRIQRPRSWFTRQTFSTLPGEESTPFVVIVSSGTGNPPRRHGDGKIDIDLDVAVATVVESREAEEARTLAGHFQAAFLALLLQQPSFMDGQARLEQWTGMSMDDIPDEAARTLCDVELRYIVRYTGFGFADGGPMRVPEDPGPDDPQPGLGRVREGGATVVVRKEGD